MLPTKPMKNTMTLLETPVLTVHNAVGRRTMIDVMFVKGFKKRAPAEFETLVPDEELCRNSTRSAEELDEGNSFEELPRNCPCQSGKLKIPQKRMERAKGFEPSTLTLAT